MSKRGLVKELEWTNELRQSEGPNNLIVMISMEAIFVFHRYWTIYLILLPISNTHLGYLFIYTSYEIVSFIILLPVHITKPQKEKKSLESLSMFTHTLDFFTLSHRKSSPSWDTQTTGFRGIELIFKTPARKPNFPPHFPFSKFCKAMFFFSQH